MKKLSDVLNPFVLLLVPVLCALVFGVSNTLHQQHEAIARLQVSEQAIPLFYKGIELFKTVCTLTKDNVW